MSTCEFSINGYERCLKTVLQYRKVLSPRNINYISDIKGNNLVLRHDVDCSIENAYHMSEIENDLGVCSIYFFRTCASYNLFSSKSKNIIRRIIDNGHEIGIHYDFIFGESYTESYDRINKEINIINELFGVSIVSGCAHQTARHHDFAIKFDFEKLDIKNNFHFSQLSEKFKYISDANSIWREGCMCQFADTGQNLYINTHPLFWGKNSNEFKFNDAIKYINHRDIILLIDYLEREEISRGDSFSGIENKFRNPDIIDKIWEIISSEDGSFRRKVKSTRSLVKVLNDHIELEKIWEFLNQINTAKK